MRRLFLDTVTTVVGAVGAPETAAKWSDPSILPDMTVGALAGHLARGGCWVVEDYLDGEPPSSASEANRWTSAVSYTSMVNELSDDAHRQIVERSRTTADRGRDAILRRLMDAADRLRKRLPAEPSDRELNVFGGAISLDEYLRTRLVEQVVHLDDLGRSVGTQWRAPDEAVSVAAHVGIDTALANNSPEHVVRALYRDASAAATQRVFPVYPGPTPPPSAERPGV